MTEYKITTDEIVDGIRESFTTYLAALSAAPDTSHLVVVEKTRLEKLEKLVADLKILIENAPEINLSNYTVDDVAELNQAMTEIWGLINDK